MIRRLAIVVMATALALTMLAPAALAVNGTAHCGGLTRQLLTRWTAASSEVEPRRGP